MAYEWVGHCRQMNTKFLGFEVDWVDNTYIGQVGYEKVEVDTMVFFPVKCVGSSYAGSVGCNGVVFWKLMLLVLVTFG